MLFCEAAKIFEKNPKIVLIHCLVLNDFNSNLVAQNNIGLKHSAVPSLQVSKINNKNKLKKIKRYLKIPKNIKQNYIFLIIFYLTAHVYQFFIFLECKYP